MENYEITIKFSDGKYKMTFYDIDKNEKLTDLKLPVNSVLAIVSTDIANKISNKLKSLKSNEKI